MGSLPPGVDLALATAEERAEVAEIHRLEEELDKLFATLGAQRVENPSSRGRGPYFGQARDLLSIAVQWAVMGVVRKQLD